MPIGSGGVAAAKKSLTEEVSVPTNVNQGLACPTPEYLTSLLGTPREQFSSVCQPVTYKPLAALIQTASVGPFNVTGLAPALDSLRAVMAEIKTKQPDVYAKLGTAGMLCCRKQRGSSRISSHSWGTAIDLTLEGKLDVRGNKKAHYGLTLIAPIFNSHGWYWGAAFRTEDAMHFEVSKGKLEQWKSSGVLAKHAPALAAVLKRGDKGPQVQLLQTKLTQHGFPVKADSDFGAKTEQAVKGFQAKHRLKPDGIVGPQTRRLLGF